MLGSMKTSDLSDLSISEVQIDYILYTIDNVQSGFFFLSLLAFSIEDQSQLIRRM